MTLRTDSRYKPNAWWQGVAAHQTELLLAGMVFVWGANFSIVKVTLRSLPPLTFNALRFLIATTLLIGILRWQRHPLRVARGDVWRVIAIGVVGHGLYQVFFIQGLAHTTAANASILMSTVPVFVALFSVVLRIERVTLQRWAGILLSFVGIVLVIVGGGGKISLDTAHLLGDLLMLGAAVTWAVYTVASKRMLVRYTPLHLTAITMVPGTAVLVVLAFPGLVSQSWASVGPAAWAGLAYSAVFSIVVAYLIWFTAVQRIGNARTAIYSNGVPVVASLLSWAVLREPFGILQAIGGVIILTGLTLAQRNGGTRS